MDTRAHWESVYETKGDAELSWFQATPTTSLALFDSISPLPERVIDVGGGQSALAGELVGRGVREIAVLDISAAAIDRARARLGERADRVRWIVADALDAGDVGELDLWHDRAVFHFLTSPDDRRRYIATVERAIPRGGHVIMATFARTGPERCSGLPVCRYDASLLAGEFGESFRLVNSAAEDHGTPWGKNQAFAYAVLRRV
ncbi:MAG: class I SAM-dependent methyltransferase [Phycisphaeraceae bacterium]|nr:class I SAM-dependent methyltransferase [Phycisphaeraceae bacterium]